MLEGGEDPSDFELVMEAERIFGRLDVPGHAGPIVEDGRRGLRRATAPAASRDQVLAGWLAQAGANRKRLLELLAAVHRYRIPPPRGTQESLVEYDRRRGVKEMLIEQIIATCVETADAGAPDPRRDGAAAAGRGLDAWEAACRAGACAAAARRRGGRRARCGGR